MEEQEKKREASTFGGRSRSPEKLVALATARAAHQARVQARITELIVPSPFASASEFLRAVADLCNRRPPGSLRDIAGRCGVNNSTVSKWLKGTKVPTQERLDKIAEFWRDNRTDANRVIKAHPVSLAVPRKAYVQHSLARLPEELSHRLTKAARTRNLSPLDYAAQILDRHLPKIEELE